MIEQISINRPLKWKKLGMVFTCSDKISWSSGGALTPTPIVLDNNTIRVFASFRDKYGVGRIGFVDVMASNPTNVINVSNVPALDKGRSGTFDDNGLILGDVLRRDDGLHLWYVGFQLVKQVKFLAFTGHAISRDGGQSFVRTQEVPVLDRTPDGLYIGAVHSVEALDRGGYRAWCALGSGWRDIHGVPYPEYMTHECHSADGRSFGGFRRLFDFGPGEYRLGRPRVSRVADGYMMIFTYGTLSGAYLPGCAVSTDGTDWTRKDDLLGLAPSDSGWDSRHLSYPALIEVGGRTFAFYNGNDMGAQGFGVAELDQ